MIGRRSYKGLGMGRGSAFLQAKDLHGEEILTTSFDSGWGVRVI